MFWEMEHSYALGKGGSAEVVRPDESRGKFYKLQCVNIQANWDLIPMIRNSMMSDENKVLKFCII